MQGRPRFVPTASGIMVLDVIKGQLQIGQAFVPEM